MVPLEIPAAVAQHKSVPWLSPAFTPAAALDAVRWPFDSRTMKRSIEFTGDELKAARDRAALSMRELAFLAGLKSKSTIHWMQSFGSEHVRASDPVRNAVAEVLALNGAPIRREHHDQATSPASAA